jgi:hypothetical protein
MYNFFESVKVTEKKQAVINQVLNGILNDEISVEMLLNDLIHCALMESKQYDIEEIKKEYGISK